MLYTTLIGILVFLAITMIGLILIQQGKGADAGAAFGSGASGTVFGSKGSANFLSRATAFIALLFFVDCLAIAYMAQDQAKPAEQSVVEEAMKAREEQKADDDVPEPGPESKTDNRGAADVPAVESGEPSKASTGEGGKSGSGDPAEDGGKKEKSSGDAGNNGGK